MKKGSVTIYMSLIMAVLLSLFLIVLEGARSRAISFRADCAFDLAVISVFGEYNRRLYKEYGLFFIDTSYGERNGSVQRTENHLRFYLEKNLDKDTSGYKLFDYTGCFAGKTKIKECAYATDENGSVFRRQAVEYIKHKYGISYVERMKKELQNAQKNELFTKDFSAQRNENHGKIEEAEKNGIETGELDEDGNPIKREVDIENPADSMNQVRSKGILLFVTEAEDAISSQSVNLSEYVSHNKPKTEGCGLKGREDISVTEELLFDAYILEKCGTYRTPKKTGLLQYQTEYILAGKNHDMENLKAVVHRLLLLREVSNCIYLFSDAAKVSEAAGLASSICTAAGVPVLIEPVKLTLLFAWAYAEAIYDVKQLLAGGNIPLIKTSATWHYSLSGMLAAEAEQVAEENLEISSGGLTYEEYLRLFLATSSKNNKTYRMMDIAEMDIRKTSRYKAFRWSNCVDLLVMEVTVGSRYGYERKLKRTYSYI